MKTLTTTQVSQVSGGSRADAIAKANIIRTGLKNGDNWATIGKNIGLYFKNKYAGGNFAK
ncbi:hypothetical protein CIN_14090 [Commensalibacter intestini A911]|uniref:Uncharacterized protein n=2 Tax=Commensalibacter intestini TaxID=479936 RepID=A0A251ZSF4_9PROT|nr:hypothetical protein [Commensalibacter intestini]EHD14050.1 hypothetical protein CIN_14090 [Commensalibacter intestini A911]OUI77599.1 hypothetical protein HK18_06525 [Commensalibacter intestini]